MSQSNPEQYDYIQLLDANNRPCENFTLVDKSNFFLRPGLYNVTDVQGEGFTVGRCPELDNDIMGKEFRRILGYQPIEKESTKC